MDIIMDRDLIPREEREGLNEEDYVVCIDRVKSSTVEGGDAINKLKKDLNRLAIGVTRDPEQLPPRKNDAEGEVRILIVLSIKGNSYVTEALREAKYGYAVPIKIKGVGAVRDDI